MDIFTGKDLLVFVLVAAGLVYCLISEIKGQKMQYILLLSIGLMFLAAWVTHIVTCLIQAKYLLLIAGAFIAPVGVIHGIGIWFGVSWQATRR